MNILEYIDDHRHDPELKTQEGKYRLHDLLMPEILKEIREKWVRMHFTKQQLKEMAVDQDFVAYEVPYHGWIIRMEYEGEIGPGSMYWESGHEDEMKATMEEDYPAWYRGRRETGPKEWSPKKEAVRTRKDQGWEFLEGKNLEWALDEAVNGFVYYIIRHKLDSA